ncbi:hypothetical protein [Castellaniella sp. UC4442_H9]
MGLIAMATLMVAATAVTPTLEGACHHYASYIVAYAGSVRSTGESRREFVAPFERYVAQQKDDGELTAQEAVDVLNANDLMTHIIYDVYANTSVEAIELRFESDCLKNKWDLRPLSY